MFSRLGFSLPRRPLPAEHLRALLFFALLLSVFLRFVLFVSALLFFGLLLPGRLRFAFLVSALLRFALLFDDS